jgi:hypothetical protein
MNKLLHRTLVAYRPLYLHGLLLDGQYRLPKTETGDANGMPRAHSRIRLATLAHIVFHPRSK